MEETACLIDWVHQAWEQIDKTEVLRGWDESGLSAAWDEEVKNYGKSIVVSLFPAKKMTGFQAAFSRNVQPQLDFEVLPAGEDGPHSTSDLQEDKDCEQYEEEEEFVDSESDEEDEDEDPLWRRKSSSLNGRGRD